MPDVNSRTEPTFYEILGLSGRPSYDPPQHVKAAYHRALLRYHPDKINASFATETKSSRQDEKLYTVDQITKAYNTLASPITRAAYDKDLELSRRRTNRKFTEEKLHNGVDVLDLEDMVYDDNQSAWSRGCRCGDSQGYVLTENELEREQSEGEIYVACKGCSLWVKVLFGTTETDHETEEYEAKDQ